MGTLAGRGPARRGRRPPAKGVPSRTVLPFQRPQLWEKSLPALYPVNPWKRMGKVNLDAENGPAAARTIGSWSIWEHEPAALLVKTANLCVLSTPCSVLQEPRSVADFGCGPAVLRRGEQAGEEVHVRRALHRRRHADPGLGLAEEFSRQGRLRR